MKTTVFLFHPSFAASRINAALASAIPENVEVRNMYELYPDFVIDVEAEQKALAEADRIVLQFPFYWYSSPALLKQWEDAVLTYGWAYGTGGEALHGKELLLAVSPGAQDSNYTREGLFKYTVSELLRPFQAVSNLIGTTFVKPFLTTSATSIGQADLEARAADYAKYLTAELPVFGDFE